MIFVVVVVGGMGSLAGAFVASLLIGVLQTFAVGVDYSLAGAASAWLTSRRSFGYALLQPHDRRRSRRSCPTCCWC